MGGGGGGGAAGPSGGAAAAAPEEVKEEKTVFDVKLEKFDAPNKIKIIKEVSSGLGVCVTWWNVHMKTVWMFGGVTILLVL